MTMYYSKRGYCERVKRKLHHMCYRLYPFIFLVKIKKGLAIFPWTQPILGEPHISVSLSVLHSSIFYLWIYFISLRSFFLTVTRGMHALPGLTTIFPFTCKQFLLHYFFFMCLMVTTPSPNIVASSHFSMLIIFLIICHDLFCTYI